MPRRLTRNAARCLACKDEVESTDPTRTDSCSCGNVTVGGGLSIVQRTLKRFAQYEDLSRWVNDPSGEWTYYCQCPPRYQVQSGARPGRCYRCSLTIENSTDG